MDAQIRITGGTEGDLGALYAWLNDEDALRGRIRTGSRPIGAQELGALPDLLTVALGAGGAGTALASCLKTWLQTRRTTVKITVESAGRTVTLDLQTLGEVGPLVESILKAGDDH
jgi:hypothetical protein